MQHGIACHKHTAAHTTTSHDVQVNATTRKLAFVAINTAIGSHKRRSILRQTWVPHGQLLANLESTKVCVS